MAREIPEDELAAHLGRRVRVTLDEHVVEEGILLGFGDGGDIQVQDSSGFIWHGWPRLKVEEVP